MHIGVSIRLTKAEVEEAIRERAVTVAKNRGIAVDNLSFHAQAKVYFLAGEGQPVPIDYADVTLET